MFASHELASGQTTLMCTSEKLNCCGRLSGLQSISCKAPRAGTGVQVTRLPANFLFGQAEARHVALEKRFQENEGQWLSWREAWLEEKRMWEASREELILEVSRLQIQSRSLKESTEIIDAELDVQALRALVETVIARVVEEDVEQRLQASLTPIQGEATLRLSCPTVQDADLLAVRGGCTPDDGLQTAVDYDDAAGNRIMEPGNIADEVDGIQVIQTVHDVAELPSLSTVSCSGREEMLSILPSETNDSEEERSELASSASLEPYLSVRRLGPSGEKTAYEIALSAVNHDGEIVLDKKNQLSTLRRLKELNVHSYVHGALRASYIRWWLKNRGVDEPFSE